MFQKSPGLKMCGVALSAFSLLPGCQRDPSPAEAAKEAAIGAAITSLNCIQADAAGIQAGVNEIRMRELWDRPGELQVQLIRINELRMQLDQHVSEFNNVLVEGKMVPRNRIAPQGSQAAPD